MWYTVGMVNETKWCTRCETEKLIGEFYSDVGRLDGLSFYCVECVQVWSRACKQKNRTELLEIFGSVCERCGFDDPRALQVDHINGKGKEDRKTSSTRGRKFINKVLANRDEYQLLCANCHCIKTIESGEHPLGYGVRKIPTADREKKSYVGKGNGEGTRESLERARTPENQKAKAVAFWTNATDEQRAEHSRKTSESRIGKGIGKKLFTMPDGTRKFLYPADFPG